MEYRALLGITLAAGTAFAAPFAFAQLDELGEIPETNIQDDYTLEDAVPDQNGIHRMAILRALDKTTGRAISLNAPAGRPINFRTLTITVRYCYTVPPEEPPQTSAFLQIDEREFNVGEPMRIFSGWMFASSPAINGLEHPVYDVWVITCSTDAPPPEPLELPVEDPFAEGGVDGGAVIGPGPDAPANE
jgi:hypothetical protein